MKNINHSSKVKDKYTDTTPDETKAKKTTLKASVKKDNSKKHHWFHNKNIKAQNNGVVALKCWKKKLPN